MSEKHEMHTMLGLVRDTRGATAIEYGLIAALIAVAAVTAMRNVGVTLKNTFGNVNTEMSRR